MVATNGCWFSSVWSQTVSRLLHKGEGFGGGTEKGAWSPRGEGVCGRVRSLRESRRERDLSPDVTLMPSSVILFSPHSGLSVSDCVCLFPCLCQSDFTLCQCLCATVGIARTSLRGQSPHDWKEEGMLVCLDSVRSLA